MARLLVAILACSLGCCSSSSSCSSSGCALDQSFEVKDESMHLLQRKAKSIEETQGDMGDLSAGHPKSKPKSKAKGKPKRKPKRKPKSKPKGKPKSKPKGKPKGKPKSKPKGKPKSKPKGKPKSCTICGDPHITVFDEAEVALLGTGIGMKHETARRTEDVNDEFGWGDFWLVKSSEVSMQARYRKVYYPKATQPLNNTYLTAMAVGGPFMSGYRLIVEPRIGPVSWVDPDGSVIELFPSDETSGNDEDREQLIFEHDDVIRANYSNRTAINANHGIVQGLDVELPSGVTLVIDRFGKHLDLRIEMTASAGGEGGVDGQCGNFNGDATDDTTELLEQRIGYQVPTDELLFI